MTDSGCAKNQNFQTRSTLSLLSSPSRKNISLIPSGKSALEPLPVPCPMRGALGRSSRVLDAGCDGRLWRDRRTREQADGEVVWSWCPELFSTAKDRGK